MAKSVNRYFRLMHMRNPQPSSGLWRPAADIYRHGGDWIVKLDLAGITPDEIQIEIEGSTLRVSGCRRDTSFGEGVSYHQLEITYSRFERVLRLPCSIDGANVSRDYRDGLLVIHLRTQEQCDKKSP